MGILAKSRAPFGEDTHKEKISGQKEKPTKYEKKSCASSRSGRGGTTTTMNLK